MPHIFPGFRRHINYSESRTSKRERDKKTNKKYDKSENCQRQTLLLKFGKMYFVEK